MLTKIIETSEYGRIGILKINKKLFFIAKQIIGAVGHTNVTTALKTVSNENKNVIWLATNPDLKKSLNDCGFVEKRASSISCITPDGVIEFISNSDLNFDKAAFLDCLKTWGFVKDNSIYLKQRKETEFANVFIPFAASFGFVVETQVTVLNYRLDFLIRELGLCIEFDEAGHKNQKDKDKSRDQWVGFIAGFQTVRIPETMNIGNVLAYFSTVFQKHLKPELSCAMSFTDSMVKQGFDLKTVSELSLKAAVPLFQGMIELGINPKALTQ